MESLPTSLFRREIGFNSKPGPAYNFSKLLLNLQCKPEDKVSLPKGSDGPMSRYFFSSEECPIFDIQFAPHNPNILGSIDEAGFLSLFDTGDRKKEKFLTRYHCQFNANMAFMWSQFHEGLVAVGSADHTVKLIDIKNGAFTLRHTYKAHEKTVKTLRFSPYHSDLLVSGSRDGSIMFWDIRINHSNSNGNGGAKPDNIISMAHLFDEKNKHQPSKSVTDLAFQDEQTLISCGATDGIIKFWDLRKTYKSLKKKSATQNLTFPKKSTTTKGFSSLALDQDHNLLYASTVSKEIFRFNLLSFSEEPDKQFEFDTRKSFYVKINLSNDGRYLISGSETDYAAIWDTTKNTVTPFMKLESDFSNICCGVFSPNDPLKIATAGDNSTVSIWRYDKIANNIHNDGCNKKTDASLINVGSDCMHDVTSKATSFVKSQSIQNASVVAFDNPINVIFSYRKSTKKLSTAISQAILTSPTKKITLNRMLTNLPDYNIDGKLPHIPEITKKYKIKRPLTWLGEMISSAAASNSNVDSSSTGISSPTSIKNEVDQLNKKIKLNLNVQSTTAMTSPKTLSKTTPTNKKLKTTPTSTGRNSANSKRRKKLIESPSAQSNLLHYFTPIVPNPTSATTTTVNSSN